MKIIKLQSVQIPAYWEIIKFATLKSNVIPEKAKQQFLISLLLDLLNDKIQVVVVANEKMELQLITIFAFMFNEAAQMKYVEFKSTYSFKKNTPETWKNSFERICAYSKESGCEMVLMSSSTPAMIKLGEALGFKEVSTNYTYQL